jgi:hypothetical protein
MAKADFLEIEQRWLLQARSHGFCTSANQHRITVSERN